MVEVNTVFEQLTSVLSSIEPAKLNETLGAIAAATSGRGEKFGQTLVDLDAYLAKLEPSLPALSHDLEVAPGVLRAYADAAPDFVAIADHAATLSDTLVDQQDNLDAALLSVIGLADIGNQVLGENRQSLTNVLQLLVPTTDLLNQYNQALWCALAGMLDASSRPPLKEPGVHVMAFQQGKRWTVVALTGRFTAQLPAHTVSEPVRCASAPAANAATSSCRT